MIDVKIVIIGAGSLTFTPSLMKGLLESEMVKVSKLELSLVDINQEVLNIMYNVCKKMVDDYKNRYKGIKIEIRNCINRREAFDGADFIISTIGVGGIEATYVDVNIPLKYGILQSIGDTVGPGGIFRALRHIPVFLDIAKDIEDLCPKAYFLNYSNPMTAILRCLVRETKVKAYGLCTGIFGMQNFLADYMDVTREDIKLMAAGINHLSWVIDFCVKGQAGYPLLIKKILEKGIPKGYRSLLTFEFYKIFGLLPVAGDRHVAEFFPYLFMNQEAVNKFDFPIILKDSIYDFKRRAPIENLLKGVAENVTNVKQLINQQGLEEEGKGVIKIIESITLGKNIIYPGVNVPNKGSVSNLPSWAVVEVPAYIDATGVNPLCIGELPKGIVGILNHRLAQFETLVDAAILGDKNLLLQAFLMDGYVNSIDLARSLIESMLEAEKRWLPSYWFK